jgi:hypothetical protein
MTDGLHLTDYSGQTLCSTVLPLKFQIDLNLTKYVYKSVRTIKIIIKIYESKVVILVHNFGYFSINMAKFETI